jgi:hypothetical protein
MHHEEKSRLQMHGEEKQPTPKNLTSSNSRYKVTKVQLLLAVLVNNPIANYVCVHDTTGKMCRDLPLLLSPHWQCRSSKQNRHTTSTLFHESICMLAADKEVDVPFLVI